MSDPSVRPPKQYIVEQVRNVLAQDPRVGELDIHVKVLDDRVFVRGTVLTPERRDVISAVLQDALLGYEINNELSVIQPVEQAGEEQLS